MSLHDIDIVAVAGELLGREPIGSGAEIAGEAFGGKRVLVTGAGGSIGTALSGLLVEAGAADLVLVDHHENSLFQLQKGLAGRVAETGVAARFALADIRDRRKMALLLGEHQPDVLIHLAAFKHVPLAQEAPDECISSNVVGTWHLFEEARAAGVRTVVYPSTDKAAYPVNIYGATKRLAELMVQALAAGCDQTRFSAVRLVNVVGAHGGVIETFLQRLAAGQNLPVTDPEMTRYWITMDEALYLLARAAQSAESGAVLIPDAGEPVRVVDIARRMWERWGPAGQLFEPLYTGIRPGERLREYLTTEDETVVAHPDENLLEVRPPDPPECDAGQIAGLVEEFQGMIERNAQSELIARLYAAVPTFSYS